MKTAKTILVLIAIVASGSAFACDEKVLDGTLDSTAKKYDARDLLPDLPAQRPAPAETTTAS